MRLEFKTCVGHIRFLGSETTLIAQYWLVPGTHSNMILYAEVIQCQIKTN